MGIALTGRQAAIRQSRRSMKAQVGNITYTADCDSQDKDSPCDTPSVLCTNFGVEPGVEPFETGCFPNTWTLKVRLAFSWFSRKTMHAALNPEGLKRGVTLFNRLISEASIQTSL